VRRAATENFRELFTHFGESWIEQYVLKRLVAQASAENYLHRVTAIYGMLVLSRQLSPSNCERVILPALLSATSDSIPNVRLVAARALRDMLWAKDRLSTADGAGTIRTRLDALRGDVDCDVKVVYNRRRPDRLPTIASQ
jgi:hypothetical protein